VIAPSGHASTQSGQNTQAPRSIVSGFAEIAPVGHASMHSAQPFGQHEESIVGLPRKRAGVDALAMSATTGCPSARLTFNALGNHDFMESSDLVPNANSWRPFRLSDVQRFSRAVQVREFA